MSELKIVLKKLILLVILIAICLICLIVSVYISVLVFKALEIFGSKYNNYLTVKTQDLVYSKVEGIELTYKDVSGESYFMINSEEQKRIESCNYDFEFSPKVGNHLPEIDLEHIDTRIREILPPSFEILELKILPQVTEPVYGSRKLPERLWIQYSVSQPYSEPLDTYPDEDYQDSVDILISSNFAKPIPLFDPRCRTRIMKNGA